MLSQEENDLLTRTGPGTPMGNLLRRYWLPALLSWEVVADGEPVRLGLLGEKLIAFRDTNGQVGLIQNHCPHRGASLFFGRNEEAGLRCVYHGWKFDVTGQCVDMPAEAIGAEAAVSGLSTQDSALVQAALSALSTQDSALVQATAYPCVERGGVVWTYMGPRERMGEPPDLEWATLPAGYAHAGKRIQESNWLQALEGGIDSSHISFLHGGVPPLKQAVTDNDANSDGFAYRRRDRSPRFEVLDTDYGVLIGAARDADEQNLYWRITQYLLPWYTMIPPFGAGGIGGHAWVPMDDENCWAWSVHWHPTKPSPEPTIEEQRAGGIGLNGEQIPGTFRLLRNARNDYLIDRQDQKYNSFTGIKGIPTQDCAVQESMGAIYDRTSEHLGSSDTAVIAMRRRLLAAVRGLERGEDPPGLDPDAYKVRSFSTLLPRGVPFAEGAKEGLIAKPGVFTPSA